MLNIMIIVIILLSVQDPRIIPPKTNKPSPFRVPLQNYQQDGNVETNLQKVDGSPTTTSDCV